MIPLILDPKPAFNAVGSSFADVTESKQVELLAHLLSLLVEFVEYILFKGLSEATVHYQVQHGKHEEKCTNYPPNYYLDQFPLTIINQTHSRAC